MSHPEGGQTTEATRLITAAQGVSHHLREHLWRCLVASHPPTRALPSSLLALDLSLEPPPPASTAATEALIESAELLEVQIGTHVRACVCLDQWPW